MNRNFNNLRVQSKYEFDAMISQLDDGSPLTQIQVKKFSGIKDLDLFETLDQDDKYETPKESSNSLMDECPNRVQKLFKSIQRRRIRNFDLSSLQIQNNYQNMKILRSYII